MDRKVEKKNRDNEIVKLFKEKKSISEIARIMNMSHSGVKIVLKRNGFLLEKGWYVKWTKEAVMV